MDCTTISNEEEIKMSDNAKFDIMFTLPSENDELGNEIKAVFSNAVRFDVDSFDANSVVTFAVPLVGVIVSSQAIVKLLEKLLPNRNVSVEYDGKKVSGDITRVKELMEYIESHVSSNSTNG
jgi:hypothetical protein